MKQKQIMPFCPGCDAEGSDIWKIESKVIEQDIGDGTSIQVMSPATSCKECGFALLTDEQHDEFYRKVKPFLTKS